MKKPKVEPPIPEPYPDAPAHLSTRAAELWRTIGPRECRTIERQTLFLSALECLDRSDAARRVVEAEGMSITTQATGAVHIHPLLRVEREARGQFSKLWSDLGLTYKTGRFPTL